ncbi:MAG: helix-turn-helix transcriptional regulator [Candidatus Tectomicrobia bacterium]|uniref:Helix-turn-helix transcriptional regulator n=1 Tax=Tectimicrobiota bacterium TaxID=2528274 RepID=A0A932I2V2_UNCTE|nr:helix-turn-helix transcriptional regulator [Candidatus Tectomicrobia bacterium]
MRKSTPSEIFPERLRAAREMRELSQGALATRAGMQPSAISHFESGTRKPSFENLRRLADALDVSTDYLLGRIKEIAGPATAEQLHRDFDHMSQDDRELAEKIFDVLKNRGQTRNKKG